MDSALRGRVRPCRPGPTRRVAVPFAALAVCALAVGCASFPNSAPSFSAQPSLTPNVVTVIPPSQAAGPASHGPSSSSQPPTDRSSSPSSPAPTTGAPSDDPCAPPELPVVAVCLDSPWGLAPLPDGQSALVGERDSGDILKVTPHQQPEPVAHIDGLDTSAGGGLLGLALSPYFAEDRLVYAYVTTATDNRIVRVAPDGATKPIFTGIPKGTVDSGPGGPIAFGADKLLYVATPGSVGSPAADTTTSATTPPPPGSSVEAPPSASTTPMPPQSLTGAVLRLDTFGKPADGNPGGGPVYAGGLSHPTGMCLLADGSIGVIDHRSDGDLLIPVRSGADYRQPASGDSLWVYRPGEGGATDCAVAQDQLLASSLIGQKIVGIQMRPQGGFTGAPTTLLADTYGRLRTLAPGPDDLTWITTANHDTSVPGTVREDPSDDKVLILPPTPESGGGGGID